MKKLDLFKKSLFTVGLLALVIPFGTNILNQQSSSSFKVAEAATYIITANANGGYISAADDDWTIAPHKLTASRKSEYYPHSYGVLPTATLAGYSCKGWFSAASGGTQVYGTTKAKSDVIIYAQWTANTYTVTLNKQSGTGGTSSTTATYDSALPTITPPTRTGYTFKGYYIGTNGSGYQYYNANGTSARKWDQTSNKTLYAYWTANAYTVTFNQQSGSGGTSSTTATYGSSMPSITLPTRTGYSFQGYYTGTNGSGTKYYNANGTSAHVYDIASGTTLYAYWTANSYYVTLDQQSGSGGSSSVTATYDSAMPTITLPSRTGHTFQGYYSGTNGTGTKYYNADGTSAHVYDIASGTTLYAYWTVNQYTITYKDQGDLPFSGTIESGYPTTHTYGTGTELKRATKDGYMFVGWHVTAACTDSPMLYLGSTSYLSNITLYAKWVEVETNTLGGWCYENSTKKGLVAFAITYSDYANLNDADKFGFCIYSSSEGGTPSVTLESTKISDLKTNEGRFYFYRTCDDGVTYYAKAFVKIGENYYYSAMINAAGDLNGTQYELPKA